MPRQALREYRSKLAGYILFEPVPKGYVFEMPVALEQLPGAGWFTVLHSGAATVRPEKEVTPEEEEQFTTTDEDLLGGPNAAAGQQG